jgi:hypothetical protein
MAGVTKHIFNHDVIDIKSMWNCELKKIGKILPKNYTEQDIIMLLKKYYPHEWHSVEIKYEYYSIKDKNLQKRKGKIRYDMKRVEILLHDVPEYKKLILPNNRKNYAKNFNKEVQQQGVEKLWQLRSHKIEKINIKIETAKIKTQLMTPEFIDQLIGLYERKNTSQKDRMYIIAELKKYYNYKVIKFFYKLNDTELNKQLREIAFRHLQSFNYQPRLRKQKYMQIHTSNKKIKNGLKEYFYQEYTIPFNPDELEYRIKNGKEQQLKNFDYFISHSSKDSSTVQRIISYQNEKGMNIFCDWINDADYLKRNLLCASTLEVIKERLEQSKAIIFVQSLNSINSKWCKYELNYFEQFKRPMYFISKNAAENNKFDLFPIEDKWYLDSNYKKDILINNDI